MEFKKVLKRIFESFGLNVTKISSHPISPYVYHNVTIIFDIGANDGGFAKKMRQQGYQNKIVSFEPLADAHKTLTKRAQSDANWLVHEQVAIGSSDAMVEINISQNSYSSSLLPMLDTHLNAAIESKYIGTSLVKQVKLDDIYNQYASPTDLVAIKIDTQGYEYQVLQGLHQVIDNVFMFQLELSIIPLYNEQKTYKYFLDFFESRGYVLWSIIPGFFDKRTGQHLQFDVIFIKKSRYE